MRRTIRGFLWLTKGMLLAIALGALVARAVHQNHGTTTTFARYELGSGHVNRSDYRVSCFRGLICFVAIREHRALTNDPEFLQWNDFYRAATIAAKSEGSGWKVVSKTWPLGDWNWLPSYVHLDSVGSWHRMFYWKSDGFEQPGYADRAVFVAARFWVIALLTGIWPISSVGLLLRQRIRKRRLIRSGQCPICGYDLRASPDRCPECGALPEVKA